MRYRRSDFLIDAEWLGLDARAALSEPELRRRRDELMNLHHPDRGGSVETASRINETYARMSKWLRRRKERTEAFRRTRSARGERGSPASSSVSRWKVAASMMSTALGAAVTAWALVRAKQRGP